MTLFLSSCAASAVINIKTRPEVGKYRVPAIDKEVEREGILDGIDARRPLRSKPVARSWLAGRYRRLMVLKGTVTIIDGCKESLLHQMLLAQSKRLATSSHLVTLAGRGARRGQVGVDNQEANLP